MSFADVSLCSGLWPWHWVSFVASSTFQVSDLRLDPDLLPGGIQQLCICGDDLDAAEVRLMADGRDVAEELGGFAQVQNAQLLDAAAG